MNSVYVVGSVNLDTTVNVARLPISGETSRTRGVTIAGGGKGANSALACASTGIPTHLVACVGHDGAADVALADLRVARVGLEAIIQGPRPTGTAILIVAEDGENFILISAGANDSLDRTHVTKSLQSLGPRDVVLTNLEVPDEAVRAATAVARSRGATLIINPAPFRELPESVLGGFPILTPNEVEIFDLTGLTPADGAMALHERTHSPVIVTLGPQGILIAVDGTVERIGTKAVDAVDTSGAGDVFNGVLAAELARGLALGSAARLAMDAATMSTLHTGARSPANA